ncbi:enoyl-CoA hydratase/isomerase family protein [Peribacillus frigoritolerans]|uniref:enoyl-CoA hydratase/isomerase family protein n=1 Tax=Peribacillus frigoritolerans TaxID=450367 RepID=UPI00201C1AF1|nr:enoyl-CoA hydratase-related protein [Peribacillus frigoritolerans]
MEESVIVEKVKGVATIFLNVPNTLNALKPSLEEALYNALIELKDDSQVKVILLTGKGRAFCAGGDISTMGNVDVIDFKQRMDFLSNLVQILGEINKPIIAAVHGYATGAGFSLALASDIIVAEKGAKFGLAFKNIGAIPDLGGHYFLPRAVGPWKAKEWIWTGAMITAEEGERQGFVNRLAEPGEAYQQAKELAIELSQGPSLAYAYTKAIINGSANQNLDDVLTLEGFSQSFLFQSQDHQEGVKAFREKRVPNFIGE